MANETKGEAAHVLAAELKLTKSTSEAIQDLASELGVDPARIVESWLEEMASLHRA